MTYFNLLTEECDREERGDEWTRGDHHRKCPRGVGTAEEKTETHRTEDVETGGQRGETETRHVEIHLLRGEGVPHRSQRYIHDRRDDLEVIGVDPINRQLPEECGESEDEDRGENQSSVQCGP